MQTIRSLALIMILAPALAAQGLSYDLRTTGTMPDRHGGPETTRTFMAGHGQFIEGMSRIDVTEAMTKGGMMGSGTYMITNSKKGTTTMVDPEKKSYIELNPAEMAKTAAGLQQSLGGIAKTEVTDVTVNVEDLGAGESLEGYSTLKYRITEGYTMTMTVLGHSSKSVEHSTTDIWIAPKLDALMNPTARPPAVATTGPMAELTEKLTKAYGKLRTGMALKRVTTSETVSGGKTNSTTMTMTISNVKRAAISPSVFEVPAGYTKAASPFDMLGGMQDSIKAHQRSNSGSGSAKPPAAEGEAGPPMSGSGAANPASASDDSNAPATGSGAPKHSSTVAMVVDSAAAGAKQAATEAAKEEAKKETKKALGSLFGSPPE